jgi:hypothetical protein
VGKEMVFVTTQVVSLKVFRPKAQMIKRAVAAYLVEGATSHGSHGSTMSRIRVFPNSLQPKIYPPDQELTFILAWGGKGKEEKKDGEKGRTGETE